VTGLRHELAVAPCLTKVFHKGLGPGGTRGSVGAWVVDSGVLGPGPVEMALELWVAWPGGGNAAGMGRSSVGPSGACHVGGNGAPASIMPR
jgi:hypothetical protein